MSEGGSATEVLKSIELGAVEYIEKPLSLLKLRNIWQHVVRKVCGKVAASAQSLIAAVVVGSLMLLHVLQMMQGNHPEESNGKLLDNKMSVDSYEVCIHFDLTTVCRTLSSGLHISCFSQFC